MCIRFHVIHSSMEITDQFYSVLNESKIQKRISGLGKKIDLEDKEKLLQEVLDILILKISKK